MKRVCSICKKVLGHVAPYENHRISDGYCRPCFSIIASYDFNYYLEYNDNRITIKPIKLPRRDL